VLNTLTAVPFHGEDMFEPIKLA